SFSFCGSGSFLELLQREDIEIHAIVAAMRTVKRSERNVHWIRGTCDYARNLLCVEVAGTRICRRHPFCYRPIGGDEYGNLGERSSILGGASLRGRAAPLAARS